jgi:subtilisin family serine protease
MFNRYKLYSLSIKTLFILKKANNIMKKMYRKFITVITISSAAAAASGQTVYKDCEDGKIWLKLKNEVSWKLPAYSSSQKQSPSSYPIALPLLSKHSVTEIFQPFPLLTSKELQQTYQISFENIFGVDELIEQLQQLPFIEYAERVPLNTLFITPNDPFYTTDQWHLPVIQADSAWNISTGSKSVVIALVDNAFQTDHPDLAANMWINKGEIANNSKDDDGNGYTDDVNGYDVADNDPNPNPKDSTFSHGTHVAGIAAAVSNNNTGIASIGYSTSIMAVKVTNNNAVNPLIISKGYEGVQYAIAAGADVINMSWGGYSYSVTAQNIMNDAWSKGIVLVAAAGNDSTTNPTYPAAYNHVIGIASAKKKDQKAKTSNYGTWIDVVSPGTTIYSTVPFNNYAILSGTSMASPLAAGLCGLILSADPLLTPDEVEGCLKSTCDPMPTEPYFVSGELGAGRINAYKALQCASNTTGITVSEKPAAGMGIISDRSAESLLFDFNFEKQKSITVILYNALGQEVQRQNFSSVQNQRESLDMSRVPSGIYLVNVTGKDFSFQSKIAW